MHATSKIGGSVDLVEHFVCSQVRACSLLQLAAQVVVEVFCGLLLMQGRGLIEDLKMVKSKVHAGIEPATIRSAVERSTTELMHRLLVHAHQKHNTQTHQHKQTTTTTNHKHNNKPQLQLQLQTQPTTNYKTQTQTQTQTQTHTQTQTVERKGQ
jgi:hypothetical protein